MRALYEAGPTGFGLARAARERGIDVRVAAPGSIPRASGDRVKTDRRDAVRLVGLLAAGELRFAFVARSRRRRGHRYPGPGGRAWTIKHLGVAARVHFDEPCSQATLADYLAAVPLLMGRRTSLIAALEHAIPESSHLDTVVRLRCFRGIDTLSAAGLCAEIGSFHRFPKPPLLSGFLVDRAVRAHLGHQAPPGLDHQGRADAHPPTARRGRPPLSLPRQHRPDPRRPPRTPGPTRDRDRLARPAAPAPALAAPARPAPRAHGRRRIAVARELAGFLWEAVTLD